MERVSNEWLDEVIPKYSAIDSKSKGANVYLALCELRERRQNEISEKDGAGATHEREKAIDKFWMNIELNCSCNECPASDEGVCESWEGTCGRSLQKKYESIAGIPHPEKNAKEMVLPVPVKQVDGVSVEKWTVKDWFQKINEELDELKEVLLRWSDLDSLKPDADCVDEEDDKNIANEAADTITAITSMLEAMCIDEQARQAAQRRVNERNAERKRL